MTDEQWQEIKAKYEAGLFLSADTLDQLIAEIERLRAEVERLQEEIGDLAYVSGESADTIFRLESEVERLTAPKPGFLAWAMQVEDLLPVGMAKGVNVKELRRWFEAGMSAEAVAERVRGEGT